MSDAKSTTKPPIKPPVDFTKSIPEAKFDTLNNETVIQTSAAQAEVIGDAELLNQPIPEATHRAQSIHLNAGNAVPQQAPSASPLPGNAGPGTPPPPPNMPPPPSGANGNANFNPGFKETQEKTKEIPEEDAAFQTASFIHQMLHAGIKKIPSLLAIKERKLKKMEEAGEINLSTRVKVNDQPGAATLSIFDIVATFNEKLKPGFDLPEEWMDAATPLLAEILKKRGGELTVEQRYAIIMTTQVGVPVITGLASAAADRKMFLDELRSLHLLNAPKPAASGPKSPDIVTSETSNTQAPPNQQVNEIKIDTKKAEKTAVEIGRVVEKARGKRTGTKKNREVKPAL